MRKCYLAISLGTNRARMLSLGNCAQMTSLLRTRGRTFSSPRQAWTRPSTHSSRTAEVAAGAEDGAEEDGEVEAAVRGWTLTGEDGCTYAQLSPGSGSYIFPCITWLLSPCSPFNYRCCLILDYSPRSAFLRYGLSLDHLTVRSSCRCLQPIDNNAIPSPLQPRSGIGTNECIVH